MIRIRFFVVLIAALVQLACAEKAADEGDLLLVTTTSVRDSGLLAVLLPVFQQQTGVRAQVIAVGSGAALRMGSDANADVLLTHAPEGEEKLVASGAAVRTSSATAVPCARSAAGRLGMHAVVSRASTGSE